MTLDHILGEIFTDRETPISLLKRHNLYDVLNNGIAAIKSISEVYPINVTRFRETSASILISVNSKLATVDPIEKQHIELLLSEVVQYLLKVVIKKIPSPAAFMNGLKESLQTASAINGYNFESLSNLLKLDQYGHVQSKVPVAGVFYYDWLGKGHSLIDLTENLKAEGTILSVKDFKKLFTKHNNASLRVQFRRESLPFLLALFDELKSKKLILPKGNKGHFHTLRVHGVDFENNVLINKEPKTIKYLAKKSAPKWEQYLLKARKWTDSYTL